MGLSVFFFAYCYQHRLRIQGCATGNTSPMILLSHGLCHTHMHFWQVHLFEFQHKCTAKKGFCRFKSYQDKNVITFVA